MYILKIYTDNNPQYHSEYKFNTIIELKQFVRLWPVWKFKRVEIINLNEDN